MKLDTRIWAVIAVIVIAALVTGGWFLGVAPQLEAFSKATSERAEVVAQNEGILTKISELQREEPNLPALQLEAASLEKIVPSDQDPAEFVQLLHSLASDADVQIVTLNLSEGERYAPPEGGIAAPTPAESADPSATPEPIQTGAPAPIIDARITGDNFVLLPISIGVSGKWANVLEFVKAVQSTERLVLLTNVQSSRDDSGLFQATLDGVMYALIREDRLQIAKLLPTEAPTPVATPTDTATPDPTETPEG